MMLPELSRQSFFSRDVAQVMRDFDEMFDSMTMMRDFEDVFYEPFAIQQRLMSRPSFLLPGAPDKASLALGVPKQTYEVSQDEKQIQIKVNVPGTEASDVIVQMDEETRLLKISGKSIREDKGISVHSSFERTFSMNRDIDISQISARMENGALLIIAPKYDKVKDSMRRIDIVDAGSKSEVTGHVKGVERAGSVLSAE
jgi:HSP20 family molecular chaperone IbpA